MIDYRYRDCPAARELVPIASDEAEQNARSFLAALGIPAAVLSLELLVLSIAVFRFRGDDGTGQRVSGWVVGGDGAHLYLNDNEIATPVEALAICDYYSLSWFSQRGVPESAGQLPDYRVPPDWEPMDYWNKGQTPAFLKKLIMMGWNIVGENREHVLHPDIRDMGERRGWFQSPPSTENRPN